MSGIVGFIKKIWQTGETISAEKLNRMEDGIEQGINRAEEAISTVGNLPVKVAEDGFTDLYDLRQLLGWKFVKSGSKITGTLTLQGDEAPTHTIVINLDANGYPSEIIVNGIDATGTWEGFDLV